MVKFAAVVALGLLALSACTDRSPSYTPPPGNGQLEPNTNGECRDGTKLGENEKCK